MMVYIKKLTKKTQMAQNEKSRMSKEDTNMAALKPLTKEELDAEFQAFVNSLEIRPPTPPRFKDGDEYMTDDDDEDANKENRRPDINQDELECDEVCNQPDDVYQ